jgi:hypothetical protein
MSSIYQNTFSSHEFDRIFARMIESRRQYQKFVLKALNNDKEKTCEK